MKSSETVFEWSKKQSEKKRRIRALGCMFVMLAFSLSLFSFLSYQEFFSDFIAITEEQQEGFYMMSLVFVVMGIFCINSTKT